MMPGRSGDHCAGLTAAYTLVCLSIMVASSFKVGWFRSCLCPLADHDRQVPRRNASVRSRAAVASLRMATHGEAARPLTGSENERNHPALVIRARSPESRCPM
jgi:hypothetical protein